MIYILVLGIILVHIRVFYIGIFSESWRETKWLIFDIVSIFLFYIGICLTFIPIVISFLTSFHWSLSLLLGIILLSTVAFLMTLDILYWKTKKSNKS